MEPTRARLVATHVPRDPEGVVLVLHGGAGRAEHAMVSPAQLSVLRMVPIAGRIARAGRRRLAVYQLWWDTRWAVGRPCSRRAR
ncbi:hypothetical protein [Nocardioides sp. P5_C9_2]